MLFTAYCVKIHELVQKLLQITLFLHMPLRHTEVKICSFLIWALAVKPAAESIIANAVVVGTSCNLICSTWLSYCGSRHVILAQNIGLSHWRSSCFLQKKSLSYRNTFTECRKKMAGEREVCIMLHSVEKAEKLGDVHTPLHKIKCNWETRWGWGWKGKWNDFGCRTNRLANHAR